MNSATALAIFVVGLFALSFATLGLLMSMS